MVSFLSIVTLALAGMAVASPLKRAPSLAVRLSADTAFLDSVDENSLVTPAENAVSSRELGMEGKLGKRDTVDCSDPDQSSFLSSS
jgi:hypothetical protein